MPKTANIREVARCAGVSPTTVSRVLNNSSIPGADTRERVLKAVEQLNYCPDPGFSAVFRRHHLGTPNPRTKTGVIGFLASNAILDQARAGDGYYSQIFSGIQKAVQENGNLLMCESGDENTLAMSEMVSRQRVDGLVVEGSFPATTRALLVKRLSVVFVDRTYPDLPASSVMMDIKRAVEEQLEYLWQLGHRRIVAFFPDVASLHIQIYQQAFRGFFEAKGLPVPLASLSRPREIDPESHARVMAAYAREIVTSTPRPTALISFDIYAASLLRKLQQAGLRIPQQISVMGIADTPVAALLTPPMASYAFSLHDMGRSAVELLIQHLRDQNRAPRHLLISGRLVPRESAGRPEPPEGSAET
ncbi:MAG: LacI family DNA-binding transcriptional regulator [Verrucomicrobiae bacterium]|nr:LacI family DNA-binding transcriptional regulator [Verrucomicrobiae bacterium]